ncbi:MAG: hypothetical protein HOV80_16830 [Polyangiaceae bacterium]|nr:hypothetical protein [Polyangiaceae bacterium]
MKTKAKTRRGSAEAIEKRRAARAFNDLLSGGARAARDGRTEKRRQRLLSELEKGTARAGAQPLKPIDILSRVQALLDLGETVAAIKKACKPPRAIDATAELVERVRRLHEAYGFHPEAYQFVGIDAPTLKKARIARPALAGGRPAARARAA